MCSRHRRYTHTQSERWSSKQNFTLCSLNTIRTAKRQWKAGTAGKGKFNLSCQKSNQYWLPACVCLCVCEGRGTVAAIAGHNRLKT